MRAYIIWTIRILRKTNAADRLVDVFGAALGDERSMSGQNSVVLRARTMREGSLYVRICRP